MTKPTLKLLVGSWHLLRQIMAFGNPTAGGFQTMAEALYAVAQLNQWLGATYGIEIVVSAHLWHELIVPDCVSEIGYSAQWNNPRAIELETWVDGVRAGRLAPIGRIIPPGFGLPGSDDGHFISPDPVRRKLAHDAMVHSFRLSDFVKTAGVGEGDVIYWTGPDGIRWLRLVQGDDVLLGHDLNPKLEEWGLVVNGVGNAVRAAREAGFVHTSLLIEGKPGGDPCYLCVFTDAQLEILGIKQINSIAGADVARWQGEFCHERGAGVAFVTAMGQAIQAGVFGGEIHFNSGGRGAVNFAELLSKPGGTRASLFPQYVDPDFLPGEGPAEWIGDQLATIQLGAKWSAHTGRPFKVEFDARFCRYADTIGALQKSAVWVIENFNEAVAQMGPP
jgi:hypothetical protein